MRFTDIDFNFDTTHDGHQNPQNVLRKYFWAILTTFISDVKMDVNICEPHYVFFLGGLSLHLNHLIG